MDGFHLTLISFAVMVAAVVVAPATVSGQTVTFSGERTGAPPGNFDMALTGQGQQVRWDVVDDASAVGGRALAQLSTDPSDYRFPLAIYTAVSAADVEVTAHFKPVAGKIDEAAGVVVRFIDVNNYYVARANALEDNIRFYRVVGGRRRQLATANGKVKAGQWHSLTLRADGNRFTVTYDGTTLYTAIDATFMKPGKVGVWTKSDSVTYFDRIVIDVLGSDARRQ